MRSIRCNEGSRTGSTKTRSVRSSAQSLLLAVALVHSDLVRGAVAFASGGEEGSGSLAPLVVMVLVAYAFVQVVKVFVARRTGDRLE